MTERICENGADAVRSVAIENKTPVGAGAYDQRSHVPVITSILSPNLKSDKIFDPATYHEPKWDRVMGIVDALLSSRLMWLHSMPYDAYLHTDHWLECRERILERAEHRCELCFSPDNLEVHHKTYARRGCERDNDLIALCSRCHECFHDILPRAA